MLKKSIKFALHVFIIVFLTVSTQIGGFIYLMGILFIKRRTKRYRWKRIGLFCVLYLIATLVIVPLLAPIFGREKIKKLNHIDARTFITDVLNRNYVRPELNISLQKIAEGLDKKHKGIKLIYLDANFPFFNKFPLVPHLSHNDGKKIDISLIYTDKEGKLTNLKPSASGYGVFENPKPGAHNQIEKCLKKGNWQYDFTRFITFGTIHPNLSFSESATKDLILEILEQPTTGKIFIEPHLKTRLKLNNQKIRYHGCQAVRQDDHIQMEL